jgi:nitrogen fixation NifU-like protein
MMEQKPGSHDHLAQLYRDAIRRHAANPVGYRQAIDATHRHEEYNPLCGDRIEIALRIEKHHVQSAAFEGEACAICLASASLLCSLAPGQPVSRMTALGAELQRALRGAQASAPRAPRRSPLPEELRPLLGVRPYPSRVRCATLPWEAAARALADSSAT